MILSVCRSVGWLNGRSIGRLDGLSVIISLKGRKFRFHAPNGTLVYLGAKITEYLLEKSRIVTHAPEERNYHVFYELLGNCSVIVR